MLLPVFSNRDKPLLKSFGVLTFIFVTVTLRYRLPRSHDRNGTKILQAFAPSGSHYHDKYRHNSSHSPAAPPPSFDFLNLNSLNRPLPFAPYDPYIKDESPRRGSRKPCLGPRGVDMNDNPDDMLIAYSVNSKGLVLPRKPHFLHRGNLTDRLTDPQPAFPSLYLALFTKVDSIVNIASTETADLVHMAMRVLIQ